MEKKEAVYYWENLRKTFSEYAEKEENIWAKQHYQFSVEAIDAALDALKKPEKGEPLTQADISQMDYEKIWIEYKDGTGEWALVYAGKIHNIDTLEGAGFGDMLQDAMQGERLDWPTGQYVAYRQGKERYDREAWEKPCSVCGGKTTLYQQTNTTKLFISTFGKAATLVTECMDCPPYADCCMKDISVNSAFKIKFCPECGRPLTEEAWAELEKRLRG